MKTRDQARKAGRSDAFRRPRCLVHYEHQDVPAERIPTSTQSELLWVKNPMEQKHVQPITNSKACASAGPIFDPTNSDLLGQVQRVCSPPQEIPSLLNRLAKPCDLSRSLADPTPSPSHPAAPHKHPVSAAETPRTRSALASKPARSCRPSVRFRRRAATVKSAEDKKRALH